MKRIETTWKIPEKIPEEVEQALSQYPNLIRKILFNRGITDSDQADKFLRANEPEYDPFLLKSLDKAIEIIHSAIEDKKKIIVFGDYDVDGVTASVVLFQVFQKYGANVEVFIPNRFDEGYGLSMDALERVFQKEPQLIITVDCGVRSIDEVKAARDANVDVIITDHHQPHEELPAANAVICPKQPDASYPYKYLAGVGIAYKVADGLLQKYPLPDVLIEEWINLVAIGTIADLAPLDGENRTLVRRGLRAIRLAKNKGVLALANISSTNIYQVRSEDIGFRIGPRLNAAGRLGSADLAFRVLIAETTNQAGDLALLLDEKNRERQKITRDIQSKAEARFDQKRNKNFMFFYDSEFNEGVMGLAASRLVETHYRPAIVGVQKGDIIRASCRSIEELNITKALDECKSLLIQHGGHAMAAGLTIHVSKVEEFIDSMNQICEREFSKKEIKKVLTAEAEVKLKELLPENLKLYEVLEPLGMENPSPLFVSRNLRVKNVRKIGRDGSHLRVQLTDGEKEFPAVAFRFGAFLEEWKNAETLDFLYAFEINDYNGRKNLQLRIVDFHVPD